MVRSGSAEIALDYMNTALILEKKQRPPDPDHKGDDMVYIIRSQCLNKLGRAQEAIEDAEVALGNDRWVAEVTGGL